jgi:hypothetical protein
MGRIAWIAVALVLLTTAPAAQAGLWSLVEDAGKVAAKDAAKAGVKGAEATANGVKIENKLGGLEATGASIEANGVKVETGVAVVAATMPLRSGFTCCVSWG